MERKTIFTVALLYLSLILILGVIFFSQRSLLFFLPDAFGPVPVGVPWFGALGAVLISLTGVFEHQHDWDPAYWPWHLSRPLIGVGLGVVSVIILKAGILAVGSIPQPQQSVPSNLLYYVVAFLVGYREESFRALIKGLVDVILRPGRQADLAPTIRVVDPTEASHDVPTKVVINGSGFKSTQSVQFGNSAASYTVDSDGQLTATTPTVPDAGPAPLTVTTKRGSATRHYMLS